jgi:hypothetical protein
LPLRFLFRNRGLLQRFVPLNFSADGRVVRLKPGYLPFLILRLALFKGRLGPRGPRRA